MKLQKSVFETEKKISPQQKKFQRLSQKIEQEKALLEQWLIAQKDVQARAKTEVLKTFEQLRQIIFQQIEVLLERKKQKMTQGQLFKLDEKIEKLSFKLLQLGKMSTLQVAFLTELLNGYGHQIEVESDTADQADFEQDPDEIEINDFEDISDDEVLRLKIETLKERLSEEYDLEPDFFDFSFDINDPDDFIEKFVKKMEEQNEQEFLDQFSGQERKQFEREMQSEQAKAAKKEHQREQAKKIANQSIKTIYLKIVAAIHPDREQNEQKKHEKTELLQKVNQAYEAHDLLMLLALQIELGQQQNVPVANQQLKAYNIVLEEQLEKLSMDIDAIIYSFDWDGHISMYSNRKIKVQDLYTKYEKDSLVAQRTLETAELVLEHFKDLKSLKALMRSQAMWDRC